MTPPVRHDDAMPSQPATAEPAGLGWPTEEVSRETPPTVGNEAGLGWPEGAQP